MPLSTGTYGKASATMTSTDLADRITAVLENAYVALETLDRGTLTGAGVDQGAVNTLRKVVQDLGTVAQDARKAAMDEAAEAQDTSDSPPAAAGQKDTPAKTGSGASGTGSSAAKS